MSTENKPINLTITISGISGSGKSTLRNVIAIELNKAGIDWSLIDDDVASGMIPGKEMTINQGYSLSHLKRAVHVLIKEVREPFIP